MKVRITLTGDTPLLLHNIRLANPLDPLARSMKAISSKRKKTDEDLEMLARLEFEGGLYIDDAGPYIPGANIEKCLVEAGRITRMGKQVERGLFVTQDEAQIIYDGPRDVEGLWANDKYRSMLAVKVTTSRVMRCRPLFREWAVEAEATMATDQLNLDSLQAIVNDAGAMVGLGDYRPRYGRFSGVVEPL